MKKVSIIIRTKNEERWIQPCLSAIEEQEYKNYEVIIVDNKSIDKTVLKAKKFGIEKIVNIDKYLPGKALNLGINEADGEYIVCLSVHCIPVTNKWLGNLVMALEGNESYAGVYGRQQPMSFSTPSDKRDLMLVFGLDRKIQIKDSFFHNANSIIKKNILDEFPFDESVTNIEDRIWGKQVIDNGYKLMYEPEASVYHYHGIHQEGNDERLKNIVNIIEKNNLISNGKLDISKFHITAVIPIRGKSLMINKSPLIKKTIEAVLKSKHVNQIIVAADNTETANLASKYGAECPFIRPKELSSEITNLEEVQQYVLQKLEEKNIFPDIIVHLEETYPFRPYDLIDSMIEKLIEEGFDTVLASKEEPGWLWMQNESGQISRIDKGDIPRKFKEKSIKGLHGLGCISHSEFIRKGTLVGNKVGLFNITSPLADFEVKDTDSINLAKKLL